MDPLRRDQHLLARPPIAGIDDDVANRPVFIINEKVLDVADVTIVSFDIVVCDLLRTAQMDILLPTGRRRHFR